MIFLAALLALPSATDLGGDVLAIFQQKCAGCHSPAAKQVQGNFDYVLDLARLRTDPNKIVPGEPDKSNVFLLTSAGNMPPNGSPTGALLVGQKEVIRGWIVAGAPVPVTQAPSTEAPATKGRQAGGGAGPPTTSSPSGGVTVTPAALSSPASLPPPVSFLAHLLRWTGELHLLLLHFPIVCIVAACLAEILGAWKIPGMGPVVTYCLVVAGIAAVPAVACGWVYAAAGHGAGQPGNLLWHRWLGTTGGVLVVATALLALDLPALKWQYATLTRRVLMGTAAAVVVVAAHFGGLMAFGEGFLSW